MKYILALASLALMVACDAQDVKQQINKDVWLPFIEAYNSFDTDGFMDIHTDDVVRVSRDGNSLSVGDAYRSSVDANNARSKEAGARRSIDFTFIQRLHSDEVAYEVGYYRVSYAAGGQEQVFYGKFHVLLRKVRGKWKVAVDSDTSNGGQISEEDFLSGKEMEG